VHGFAIAILDACLITSAFKALCPEAGILSKLRVHNDINLIRLRNENHSNYRSNDPQKGSQGAASQWVLYFLVVAGLKENCCK
jgi:hypothetical protein